MKAKRVPRERNQFVAAALFRKAGSHRKTNKAMRKSQNQKPVDFSSVLH
jgi:hypothetical protein